MDPKTDVNANNADAIQDENLDHEIDQQEEQQEQEQQPEQYEDTSNLGFRERKIAEMLQGQNERRDQELKENGYQVIDTSGNDEEDPEVDPDQEPKQEEAEQEQQDVALKDNSGVNSNLFASDKVTLKVNGIEQEFTAEQAKALLQKDLAGDAKLEEANRRLQEVERREAQLNQNANSQQPSTPDVEQVDNKKVNELYEQAAIALEDGDHARYAELNTEAQQLIIKHNDEISRREIQRQQANDRMLEAQNAEQKLLNSGDYDDIFKDPMAYSIAAQQVGELQKSGFQGTTEEVMLEAISRVRNFSGKGKKAQDANTRLDKKRASPTAVRSSQGRSGGNKPVKRELTQAEKQAQLFENARRARNQA